MFIVVNMTTPILYPLLFMPLLKKLGSGLQLQSRRANRPARDNLASSQWRTLLGLAGDLRIEGRPNRTIPRHAGESIRTADWADPHVERVDAHLVHRHRHHQRGSRYKRLSRRSCSVRHPARVAPDTLRNVGHGHGHHHEGRDHEHQWVVTGLNLPISSSSLAICCC